MRHWRVQHSSCRLLEVVSQGDAKHTGKWALLVVVVVAAVVVVVVVVVVVFWWFGCLMVCSLFLFFWFWLWIFLEGGEGGLGGLGGGEGRRGREGDVYVCFLKGGGGEREEGRCLCVCVCFFLLDCEEGRERGKVGGGFLKKGTFFLERRGGGKGDFSAEIWGLGFFKTQLFESLKICLLFSSVFQFFFFLKCFLVLFFFWGVLSFCFSLGFSLFCHFFSNVQGGRLALGP